jgi:hypothetical protein
MNLNNQIRYRVENGNYIAREYYESIEDVQKRMSSIDYSYYISTANNILNFYTKDLSLEIPVSEFEWRILWDKLGNIPVNEDDEIEEPFEHFAVGTDKFEIWHWFEWFFDITLGEEI